LTLYNYWYRIRAMQYKQNPETLLVLRDGQVDDSYYEAIYSEKRREALRTVGKEALHLAVRAPLVVGKGIVYLLTPEELRPQNRHAI
jgi:hypothetical protein